MVYNSTRNSPSESPNQIWFQQHLTYSQKLWFQVVVQTQITITGKRLFKDQPKLKTMATEIELPDDLVERIDQHREEGETYSEFIDELLNIYASESTLLQEGGSE